MQISGESFLCLKNSWICLSLIIVEVQQSLHIDEQIASNIQTDQDHALAIINS